MFTRAFLSAAALIALSSFAVYHFHLRMRPEDIQNYHKLIQESADLRARRALEAEPAHQVRRGVQKDIWTPESRSDQARHVQIQSAHSELTLFQKKGKLEAVEKLQQIHCSVAEDLTLTADEGTYTFPSHQFIAEKNCSVLQQQHRIDGSRIHFDLLQEIVTYDTPSGFIAPFHFTADKLTWLKKEDQFLLEGNVRLMSTEFENKESYAVAEQLIYNLIDKTLLLTSNRRVLFWQEGLSLSASEVLIREDRSVEGRGDVHFTFDLDEQNSLEQLFGHFL